MNRQWSKLEIRIFFFAVSVKFSRDEDEKTHDDSKKSRAVFYKKPTQEEDNLDREQENSRNKNIESSNKKITQSR